MNIVQGKNVTVRIYDGGWKLYGCARDCSINKSTTTVETSTTGSGIWATYKPQKHGWTGSISGLVNLDDSSQLSAYDLSVKQNEFAELQIQYELVDASGNYYLEQGKAYIVGFSLTGSFGDFAAFNVELLGTGELIPLSN